MPTTGPGRRRHAAVQTCAVAIAGATGLVLLAAAATMRDGPTPGNFGITSAPITSSPSSAPPQPVRAAATRPSHPAISPTTPAMLPAAPAQLTIPTLGVHAPVQPVLTTNSQLDVPDDPLQLGWWAGSARIGATTGTIVIDGHVDSATAGPGALFRLTDLNAAARIVITTTTGQHQTYLVTGRRIYPKTNALPPDLFTTTGPPRLILITCGGSFNATTHNYQDNMVLFATPTPDAADPVNRPGESGGTTS
jgi:Sortase domain